MTEPDETGVASAGKVLFVDDEENILRALTRLFLEEGLEVFTASSGSAGLEVLGRQPQIGVIVSDQRMPQMSGVEFLEQSRAFAPQAMRILLTGYADVNAAIDAINRGGAYRYLGKPWNDEDLVQTVKDAMRMYSLVIENRRLNAIIKKQNAIVKKQNAELKRWSAELETIVQEQTTEIEKSNDGLRTMNARLKSNFKQTIIAFSGLIELRDPRMRTHSRNVAEIAVKVGHKLGIKEGKRESLTAAALLHDIGKIGISDVMLQLELEIMDLRQRDEYLLHPVRGQAAIDRIDELREAGVIIRAHHENYEGGGFPDGLRRSEIPLGARIIAIADYIDKRMRKYSWTVGADAIKKEVEGLAGHMFDPKLVPLVFAEADALYRKLKPQTEPHELELLPKNLLEGMEVGRDVFSGTGILLMTTGSLLTKGGIALLDRYYKLDPPRQGVYVVVKG